jgi:hypothetical protein
MAIDFGRAVSGLRPSVLLANALSAPDPPRRTATACRASGPHQKPDARACRLILGADRRPWKAVVRKQPDASAWRLILGIALRRSGRRLRPSCR